MRKIIILIILGAFFSNCTMLERKQFENPYYKKAKFFYNKWELENAKLELKKIIIKNKDINELNKNIQIREKRKSELEEIIIKIKKELGDNNFAELNKHIKKGIINNIKIKKIKENDFSMLKIYSGKIKFDNNKAKVLLLFNYLEETFYYEVEFQLKKKNWSIYNIKERR